MEKENFIFLKRLHVTYFKTEEIINNYATTGNFYPLVGPFLKLSFDLSVCIQSAF